MLEEQPATAVYTNNRKCHRHPAKGSGIPDEDQFVFIAPHNLMTLIDRLCDMAGIPSAGKRR